MSGFASPYEEDNPFADMHGGNLPASPSRSKSPVDNTIHHPQEPGTEPSDMPVKNDGTSTAAAPSASISPPRVSKATELRKSESVRRSGGSRKPIRASAIVSRLEQLDLESGPLGPLGISDETDGKSLGPPTIPSKDLDETRQSAQKSSVGHHAHGKSGPGTEIGLPSSSGADSTIDRKKPSIPLEHAANPTYIISVGDPTKIGDITSAHTVYKVSTKTTSQAFRSPESNVTRRYRDFLWLYEQLNRNCPGAIVPPPPEKQAVGRFSDNFIEARRYALERMLEKISRHPALRLDPDFRLFLESETFSADIKHKPIDQRVAHETNKGFLGLGNAFSFSGKFVETDEFFDHQKISFEMLDQQLRQLSKAVDVVIRQRKDLAQTTADFGAALSALSTIELSRSLADALGSLSDLQEKIKDLHERQAQQDLLTLGHTVEEYIRLITSVKAAFSARQRAWLAWQSADSESAKRRSTGDKIRRQARTQQDRLNLVEQELSDADKKANQHKIEFENIGKLLRKEIQRFNIDKVEDFKTSVEVFLESAVEAQKEVIEHWEFYSDLLAKELEDDHDSDETAVGSKNVVVSQASEQAAVQNTNTTISMQEEVLENTTIQPLSPTPPHTASTVESSFLGAEASGVPIPHEEANPFASESL